MMATVVLTPAQVEAFWQQEFMATAFHIVQQDRTGTVAKVGLSLGCCRWAAADLPAHHVGIVHVPVVITHCPPNGFVEDLYPTWAAVVAVHKTNGRFSWTEIKRRASQHSEWAKDNVEMCHTDINSLCVQEVCLLTFCQSRGGNIGCDWWPCGRNFIGRCREDIIRKSVSSRSRPLQFWWRI